MKVLVGLLAVVFAVGYFMGFANVGGYSRVVDRSPAEVVAGIEGLDIGTDAPGGVGTDPSRSGGVRPEYRIEKAPDHVSWYVMSGEKVATKMTAFLEPIDGGKKTRVTTKVERGDAPDDLVSPAFRSTGLTMGLFTVSLDTRLDRLTAPRMASKAACDELLRPFREPGADPAILAATYEKPANLKEAVGQTSNSILKLAAIQQELRRRGCPMGFDRPGDGPSQRMAPGSGFRKDGDDEAAEQAGHMRDLREISERQREREPRFGEPMMQPNQP